MLPVGQVQTPETHVSPPRHALPHAPQFAGSLFSSTHAPEHAVRPVPHPAEQTPLRQSGVAPEQTVPHAPQFAGSDDTSTHAPPHARVPTGQTHALPAQI